MADPAGDRPRVLNIPSSFDRIAEKWSPHVAARVNSQEVRLAKIDGAFDWHFHDGVDEAFIVVKGGFSMAFRRGEETWTSQLSEGDMVVVPAGLEHRPVADEGECWIMMIENAGTLNTGNVVTEKTKQALSTL